ncbi:class I SAM-dependent RNA methyltransferase [Eubacterium sp. AF15-50]|uniref:THUMP domain-containing class I SAM-dependent RNA methyltransferase n=1 Tax=Eubacterium sp. AF15-50 TaxID=2293103 RepID=UPI00267161E0|nr:class I SAM-dependent RNA methyltransferase [Eubacterium sp. AF15-50]
MDKLHLIVPCHFGVESVLKREIIDLGYEIERVEDGRITFSGNLLAICRANVFLRTAERVMIQVGRVKAQTYDELFEAVKALKWSDFIPENGKFWVKKASSVKSKLFSPSDIQRIVKKAIVENLKQEYGVSWFSEDGASYPIRVFFYKDEAVIALDTSGESLHKRGYRYYTSKAPISETLAAALIMLTPWNKDRILVDPFCGCGTFPIEAAMIAANIAPGMNREFTGKTWTNFIDKKLWYQAVNEANDKINDDIETDIQGYDIDGEMIEYSRKNAINAGVEHLIHFQERPVSGLSHRKKYGFIITNPPYGERLEEQKSLQKIYTTLGEKYKALDSWSAFIISSYENVEKDMGIKATKNRKIYNGMIKTYYYQFMGPKPPKNKNK